MGSRHVKISNEVGLAIDRPKAKAFNAVGKLSSMMAHWLHKITHKDEASKRLGARSKSQKNK
jgi:hypothetical protein